MSQLKNAFEDKKMDIRLRDKLTAEGLVGPKEVEDFLNSLPDESGNYSVVEGTRTDVAPRPKR